MKASPLWEASKSPSCRDQKNQRGTTRPRSSLARMWKNVQMLSFLVPEGQMKTSRIDHFSESDKSWGPKFSVPHLSTKGKRCIFDLFGAFFEYFRPDLDGVWECEIPGRTQRKSSRSQTSRPSREPTGGSKEHQDASFRSRRPLT